MALGEIDILVALGSALFVLVPQQAGTNPGDMTRVLQGLVAGIGFLGASAAGPRPIQYADPFQAGPVSANPDPRCQSTISQGGIAADATGTVASYYNRCAFQTLFPTAGISNVPGNAGRGILEGPGTKRLDLSLMKNFRFTESINLQLRGEVFNIFNTTNFAGFTSVSPNASTFGVVNTVRDPRAIQLGIKFLF